MPKLLIFTDLDGTLLDHHTYSAAEAMPTLARLKHLNIPCLLNTSKTFAELLELRQKLHHQAPFIVENGAAIYLPKAHFPETFALAEKENVTAHPRFYCKAFGPSRQQILGVLSPLKSRFRFTGFDDMSTADIVRYTGLSSAAAQLARQREFTEPLIWKGSSSAFSAFTKEIEAVDLQIQRGGRFVHVMGKTDKAQAMLWLANQYREHYQQPVVKVALGDGENDVGMLSKADIAIIIRSPSHPPPLITNHPQVWLSENEGPAGWASSIQRILTLYGLSSATDALTLLTN